MVDSTDTTFTYLKHLGGHDDGLANNVALSNHHLLSKENLAGWDLDTQITTSNHNTVRLLQDLVKVSNTLLVLDLDDDLDIGALRAQNSTDVPNIVGATNKGSKDHVNSVFDTKLQVLFVLFRQCGQVNIGLGKVDTLAGGKGTIIQATDAKRVTFDRQNKER